MGHCDTALVVLVLLATQCRLAIVTMVSAAASLRVPATLDGATGKVAVLTVILYRRCLSHWLGNQCLFSPSCSQHALNVLRESGWNVGVTALRDQLQRCCGDFLIRLNDEGALELETVDGLVVSQDKLSQFVIDKFAPLGALPQQSERAGRLK